MANTAARAGILYLEPSQGIPLDRHRAQILYDVARRVLQASSLSQVIHGALEGLQELVPAWRYSVGLIDTVRLTYQIFETAGEGRSVWSPGGSYDLGDFGGDLRALRRGEYELRPDLPASPRSAIRSQLILPIRDHALLLGTMNLGADQPNAFTADHIDVAQELANLIAVALARESMRQELVRAYDHAKEANEAKTRFLAHMSHELRTPLNAIIGYVELIREHDGPMSPDALDADLGRVHAASSHLLTLINQVLDLEKVESGRSDITLASVDLTRLLEDIDDVVAPLVAQGQNTWTMRCPEDTWVLGDPLRLRQVLLNLVGNAAKFTTGGAVQIGVDCDDQTIKIAVSDTGIGIHAEQLGTLFEPFTQAHTDSLRHGGTGLGLAISRRYVDMMGGQIHVESEVGRGSTFTVTLLRSFPE